MSRVNDPKYTIIFLKMILNYIVKQFFCNLDFMYFLGTSMALEYIVVVS